MAILNNSNAISTAGGYDINNSLRFRSSASAYLNRTPASTTNRQTWTWSGWVKRGTLGARQHIFVSANPVVNTLGQQEFQFCFDASDRIEITGGTSGVGQDLNLTTTQVFRDPSAWYHFVVVADTTQATSSNRIKFYVNGVQVTAFGTAIYPAQNHNTAVNLTGFSHRIGGSGGSYLDAYQADINFIDGQALTPSSFGETDTTTGSWKPKAYSGTYGTNGFYLKFSDIATTSGSNAGLGKDFSTNTNYWTTNNISVTAGTTYDAMLDVPTLTSATVANYCVLNPLAKTVSTPTFSNGNLQAVTPLSGGGNAYGTIQLPSSGKFYWEATCTTAPTYFVRFGVAAYSATDTFFYNNATSLAYDSISGDKLVNTVSSAYGSAWNGNQVIGIAVDLDAGTVTFYNNGTSQGAITYNAAGLFPVFGDADNVSATYTNVVNFGQRPFAYTPPTGFLRLNTYNLPDSTIKKGSSYMNAILYTGDGTNGRAITTGMATDFAWIKKRSAADNHELQDRVRGAAKRLQSNSTAAEVAISAVASFTSTGFTVDGWGTTNENGFTYVAWSWLANGSGSTNTSGSITSTVSANTTAGFSIVTYTGTGTTGTVGHGLGVAPKMLILKARNQADSWLVYHSGLPTPATNTIILESTGAVQTSSLNWNSTNPTSSVFSVYNPGSGGYSNGNGYTYVAYCWAEISGFSKAFSYTGNGSTNGPFVFTNFKPKFVIIKCSSAAGEWAIYDINRGLYNPNGSAGGRLQANTSNAETGNDSAQYIDFLSNGFKIRNVSGFDNDSGQTYIGMAFSSNPFKNSTAV
jgi:hypothetical protein